MYELREEQLIDRDRVQEQQTQDLEIEEKKAEEAVVEEEVGGARNEEFSHNVVVHGISV